MINTWLRLASFRFTPERMALFRADIGFAGEGVNVSLGFGNSFK